MSSYRALLELNLTTMRKRYRCVYCANHCKANQLLHLVFCLFQYKVVDLQVRLTKVTVWLK